MQQVAVAAQPLSKYIPITGKSAVREVEALAAAARERFSGRVVWNINSTARGGGVAEMLLALLPYVRGAGIDMRWMVLGGTPEFFRITKRVHHALHGSAGDGSPLDDAARSEYEAVLREEFASLKPHLSPGDLFLLHDPQPAGMIPELIELGGLVAWRCHVGLETRNEQVDLGWRFLRPYVERAHGTVFSREGYIPDFCDSGRSTVIQPSLDPFSPKNQPMEPDVVRSILLQAGLVTGPAEPAPPTFVCSDGSPGRVERKARFYGDDRPPAMDDRLVVQVSRWDPLKDPVGVIRGFEVYLQSGPADNVHLVLAGPDPESISDDPEGRRSLGEVLSAWEDLPEPVRARVHPVSLPMESVEENAAMVNALQRHAAVVVQKSLAEGFGLTVTEAMAKGRPILASAVGGIVDQVEDGVHGRLLFDPRDAGGFAALLQSLLNDRRGAEAMGERARERAREQFLGLRSLRQYAALFARIAAEVEGTSPVIE